MAKSFILVDESVNKKGFRMLMSGAQLDQFRRNPVMLFMHQRADKRLPIGYWENIRIEGTQLLADPVFDENDPFAQQIKSKVDSGVLKMASIGAQPLETSGDYNLALPGQTKETVVKWLPIEASIVDIGANNNAMAVALYDNVGNLIELSATDEAYPVRNLVTPKNYNMSLEKVKGLLKLADDADESALESAIISLQADNVAKDGTIKDLETKVSGYESAEKAAKKAEAIKLVDEAVKDGRLDASAKATYIELFDTNHETAVKVLAGIPKRVKLSDKIDAGAKKDKSIEAKLIELAWDEIDKQNLLGDLKKLPDLYAEKFTQKFGHAPVK